MAYLLQGLSGSEAYMNSSSKTGDQTYRPTGLYKVAFLKMLNSNR